jgi:tRNA (guanosine-2'-O-)-methyltransferase
LRRTTPSTFHPDPTFGTVAPWPSSWTAEGVIELLAPLVLERRRERILQVLAHRVDSVCVVMDAPHDPHNGAAVIRSCDAFGVQSLHVIERTEPFLAAEAVSLGTERWVDIITHPNVATATQVLRAGDYQLVLAHPEGTLEPEQLRDLPRPALVMGNEKDGVCAELAQHASHTVRVPMRGFVESLNVSVTTALLLHAATRGRPGDLSPERHTFLHAKALYRTVPRVDEVLANLPAR